MAFLIAALVVSWAITVGLLVLSYRLLTTRGQLLLRTESLEHQLNQLVTEREVAAAMRNAATGLPAGSVLTDFELPLLTGGAMTLSQLRGKRALLMYFDPKCSYSRL